MFFEKEQRYVLLTSAYRPVLDLIIVYIKKHCIPITKYWIHCAKVYKQQNESKPDIILTLGKRKFETIADYKYNTAIWTTLVSLKFWGKFKMSTITNTKPVLLNVFPNSSLSDSQNFQFLPPLRCVARNSQWRGAEPPAAEAIGSLGEKRSAARCWG